MEFYSQKITDCGALILGTPVYWWDTSGLVKYLILGAEGRAKVSYRYLSINIPEIGVFSGNIVFFRVKIGSISYLRLSKLKCHPGLNDLSTPLL